MTSWQIGVILALVLMGLFLSALPWQLAIKRAKSVAHHTISTSEEKLPQAKANSAASIARVRSRGEHDDGGHVFRVNAQADIRR